MSKTHLNCKLVKDNMFDNLQAQNQETLFTLLSESQLCVLRISKREIQPTCKQHRSAKHCNFHVSQKKDRVALLQYCQTDVVPVQHA